MTHFLEVMTLSRDQGHDPLSSEATVVVRIDDLNDNAPTVTVRTLHGTTSTELPESSAVGSFVAHVSVVDRDSAASGHVNCSVNHPSVFTLRQNVTFTLTIEVVTLTPVTEVNRLRCHDAAPDILLQ